MTALTDEAIGVVVTRRVPVANVEAFETAMRELMRIASKQPGQVTGDVLRGAVRGGEREYFIVYRFADEARLRAWEASPERRALVGRIDPLTIGGRHHELTGLEAWFELPPGQLPPPLHRMAFVTWLGIPAKTARGGVLAVAVLAVLVGCVRPPRGRGWRSWEGWVSI